MVLLKTMPNSRQKMSKAFTRKKSKNHTLEVAYIYLYDLYKGVLPAPLPRPGLRKCYKLV